MQEIHTGKAWISGSVCLPLLLQALLCLCSCQLLQKNLSISVICVTFILKISFLIKGLFLTLSIKLYPSVFKKAIPAGQKHFTDILCGYIYISSYFFNFNGTVFSSFVPFHEINLKSQRISGNGKRFFSEYFGSDTLFFQLCLLCTGIFP